MFKKIHVAHLVIENRFQMRNIENVIFRFYQ